MKKKIITLIIVVVTLSALVAGWFVYQTLTAPESVEPDEYSPTDTSPFFPSGGGNTTGTVGTSTSSGGTPFSPIQSTQRLRMVHIKPVVGATFVLSKTGSTTIRFMESETGHIFERNNETGEVLRLTNTTIPHIQNVVWGENASTTVLQYLQDNADTIETFIGTIEPEQEVSGVGSLVGSFLPNDISFVSISPDTQKVLYLLEESGNLNGYTYTFKDGSVRNIFTLPLTEVIPQWVTDTTILLTTRVAHGLPGYTYQIKTTGLGFSKLLGPVSGLTSLSDGLISYILYAREDVLFVHTLATGVSESFGLKTIPDKCVWSTKNTTTVYCAVPQTLLGNMFPENWYQGKLQTEDALWKLDVAEKTSEIIFNPETEGLSFDVDTLSIDPDETHLLIHDRNTSLEYLLRIEK
jgi:hypothetical protein